MTRRRATILRALLAIVPALLLTTVLSSVIALAADTVDIKFTNDGHGTVQPDSQTVSLSQTIEFYNDDKWAAGQVSTTDLKVEPNAGYEFDYWTASENVYEISLGSGLAGAVPKGTKLYSLSDYYVTQSTTFEAHFKQKTCTIAYKSAGNGSVSPETWSAALDKSYPLASDQTMTRLVASDISPDDLSPQGATGYEFDYWTFVGDVYALDQSGPYNGLVPVSMSTKLSTLSGYYVAGDTTFTAHFKAKPVTVTVTYHGDVSEGYECTPDSESVELTLTYPLDSDASQNITAGAISGSTATTILSGYYFDYWTADEDIYRQGQNEWITVPKGTELTSLEGYYVAKATTFTPHFYKNATVTYKGDTGVESLSLEEETVKGGGSPTGCTVTTKRYYEFSHWTCDTTVKLQDGTIIFHGNKITDDQLKQVVVPDGSSLIFTANTKQISRTATFATDGNGSVDPSSKAVSLSAEAKLPDGNPVLIGNLASSVSLSAYSGWEFAYWEASEDVYMRDGDGFCWYTKGTKLPDEDVSGYWIAKDTTFTAYFKPKPVTVTYTTDGHGSVASSTEQVELNEYRSEVTHPEQYKYVGAPNGTKLTPNTGYEFDYWTNEGRAYILGDDGYLTRLPYQDHITGLPNNYRVSYDTEFKAHFKRVAYSVTYKTDGNGSVTPGSELVQVGDSPAGYTIAPNKGYEFSHWTANVDVEIADEDATQAINLASNENGAEPQASATTTITAGDPITDEQLKRAILSDDAIITAHFKQTAVDPDGGDTIKPADGANGKLTPKTGDTLPSTTAAVALGAGVVVAGAVLLKKRVR